MKRRAKSVRVTKSPPKGKAEAKTPKAIQPEENLEQMLHHKEEIEALLSSLEDAYSEASILEEDYNEIKAKNERKLEEVSKKIDALTKKQTAVTLKPEVRAAPSVRMARPRVEVPVVEEIEEEAEEVALEEKPKKEKKAKPEKTAAAISDEDLEKLKLDLAEKIKEMVEDIGAKVTEKDLAEIKTNFAKFEAEIDKMKALLETVRETRRIDDEKIQRVVEGLAEVRTMVYGREASVKEQEIRLEKIMDVTGRLEPERLIMEMGKRDKEISNQALRINKLEETSKEFSEMLRRIEALLRNIGSLEHVIRISNEASEKLLDMQNIQRSSQKMLDKIQGIYVELSKRMEEFMLYRAKQDRIDDLMNDVLKNIDELNTKAAYFVTKDDMESFRASIQTAVTRLPSEPGGYSDLKSQKEEIEILLKSIEDEFRNKAISKEEFEKMKMANLAKLKEIEGQMAGRKTMPAPVLPVKRTEPVKAEKKPMEAKASKETKGKTDVLLKDLEDTFRKGFISKEAYEKTKKMILGKR